MVDIRSWHETLSNFNMLDSSEKIDLIIGVVYLIVGLLGFFLLSIFYSKDIPVLSDLGKMITVDKGAILEAVKISVLVVFFVGAIVIIFTHGLKEVKKHGSKGISFLPLIKDRFLAARQGQRSFYTPENDIRAIFANTIITIGVTVIPTIVYLFLWEVPALFFLAILRQFFLGKQAADLISNSVDFFFAAIFVYLIYEALIKLYSARGFKVDYISLL